MPRKRKKSDDVFNAQPPVRSLAAVGGDDWRPYSPPVQPPRRPGSTDHAKIPSRVGEERIDWHTP